MWLHYGTVQRDKRCFGKFTVRSSNHEQQSLQWADAVMVVSRGTPKSRTSVTWEIWWSVSAAEKDGEREGRFPTVRHEHLLGLIGRSSDNEKQCYLQVNQGGSLTSLNLIN